MLDQLFDHLTSRPHNIHYVKRYYHFIHALVNQDMPSSRLESHHILPKADDMFPEFKQCVDNIIKITPRQHFICHWLLSKAYGGSQHYAFWSMCTRQSRSSAAREGYTVTSRTYAQAKAMVALSRSEALSGQKRPTISDRKRGTVMCYDQYGTFLTVTREEFHRREDLVGVRTGTGNPWMQTREAKDYVSDRNKHRRHMYHPTTNERVFVKKEHVDSYQNKGFVLGNCTGAYDRRSKQKTCEHCSKVVDPANYGKWHGPKCKHAS